MEWTRGGRDLARRSLEALRVGVVVLDADDRPVVANPSAREMGLLRPSIAGAAPAVHSLIRALAGQARHAGARRELEIDLPRGDQEPLGVHVAAVALDDGHVTIEARDVTRARRINEMRRDFVANVSHELKTPVGALQLLAEALREAIDGPAMDQQAAVRFAERISRESSRLGRLVTELLELSRLQGGEPLPDPAPAPLDRVVAEVLDRTRTAASARRVEVTWAGACGLIAYGNEGQLVTALANLVDNAIAYTPERTGTEEPAHVIVRAARTGERIELSVSDQGIGIEPKDLDRIFERFYRADRARSRATGGIGLGLAIVKHIATNHGGAVTVRSALGVGSTFTLRLPARFPQDAPPPSEPDGMRAGSGGRVRGRR